MPRLSAPRRPWLAASLLLFAGALPGARAAETWPVARGAAREAPAYRFDRATLAKLPKAFLEDAAACILYAGSSHVVEADGTIETVTHEVTRLNGRKGIEKVGEYRNITYTPAYQKLTLHEARIHKPSGAVVEVQPRHVHLRDVSTDFQTYDPEKQLVISFPALEVGDVVEVRWTVRGKNPEHAGHFFSRYSFGDAQFPVALDQFIVRLPKDRPLKYATAHGKVDLVVSTTATHRTFTWGQHDIPRPPRDEDLPSREELRATLLVSTFTSWEQIGAWKQKLRASSWECIPEIAKVVAEVARSCKTPHDKARALTYWVRRNIRYVSAGEKHDYTPHPPGRVLANRFGDCKDSSQLLAVLLREAGLKVELATLGALDDGQVNAAVPSPWGTHAILLVTIDGKDHWIDTTARLFGWDVLPRDDRGRLCYLTPEKGKARLLRTPAATADDHRTEQVTEVWVNENGDARCVRTAVSHGLAAAVQRERYLEVPPGERRRQVTAALQDANSRTRLTRLDVNEAALEDFDRPVAVQMEFEIPRQFTGTTNPEGSFTDSTLWARLLAHNIDHDRKAPLVLPNAFEAVHRYVVHLPPTFVLEAVPKSKDLRTPWGKFVVEARSLDPADAGIRNVEFTFRTRLEKPRVEPADLEEFRKFHEEIGRDYRVWLTLKPARDKQAVALLEAQLAFHPDCRAAAVALARLHERQGRLADATRVLRTACAYHPDDAELWKLRVDCADGPTEEETAQRELVRRFPDDPEHALALGRILVGQGKQREARAVLTPLVKKENRALRASAHFQLARSHYRQDELKPALEQLRLARQADEATLRTVSAYRLEAQVLEELGKPAEALKAYRQALAAEVDNQEVLLSLLRLALVLKDRQAALDYLRRYALLVRRDRSGLQLAAQAYLKLGRTDDALELALRARDLGFHEKTQRLLGLAYLRRADDPRAVQHLEKAEADATVLAALLGAYLRLGKLRELEGALEKAARLDRVDDPLRRTMERGRSALKRRAELGKGVSVPPGKEAEWAAGLDATAAADELWRRQGAAARPAVERLLARAFAPGLAIGPAYGLRGRLGLERGKLTSALADAEEAVRLAPGHDLGYLVRGRVRLERGTAGALDDLRKAAALSARKDADVLHSLAEALSQAGKRDEALAAQREAVKLRPGDRELLEQLRALEAKRAG
jgi:tetratricopeptide (TPR) repeat protein